MWVLFAFLSAFFAGMTSILAKCGIKKTDSNVATFIRTLVVLPLSLLMALIVNPNFSLGAVSSKTLVFLVLSGLSTGASWLCYYKALQDGEAGIVVPIDKLSILVTIAFSYIVFKERLSKKAMLGLVMIVFGTLVLLV